MQKNNSNECVNVRKAERKETHSYLIGETHFNVNVVNKNQNPKAVMERLKSVVVNHTDTKI